MLDREIGKKDIFTSLDMIVRRLYWINAYISINGLTATSRILDVGCSYGYFLRMLKCANERAELYGMDISAECVKECKKQVPDAAVFHQSCVETFPLESNSMDVITCWHVVEHLQSMDDLSKMFREIQRVLKAGGFFFIETPNCNWLGRRFFDLNRMSWVYRSAVHPLPLSYGKLKMALREYFNIEKFDFRYDRHLPHQKLFSMIHFGPWLSVIAQKAR